MIRLLFLVLVFAVGLAAAVVYKGQIYHLRRAVPDLLPGWTDRIAEDASLRSGSIRLPATAQLPETTLFWDAVAPGADGWKWQLRLTGDGIALTARATLGFWPDRAVLDDGAGTLDLSALAGLPVQTRGVATLEALSAEVTRILAAPVFSGDLTARLAGLRVEGDDFGQGPLRAVLDADGGWRADLELAGGVSPITGRISGKWPGRLVQLDMSFADGAALPDTLRGILSAVAVPAGQGWRLSASVPFP